MNKQIKSQIAETVLRYQNAVTEYFELEIPAEYDADNMDAMLNDLKEELLALVDTES